MPDACFAHPRLASIHDALDPDRSDLDLYASITSEIGARSVLDIGCGTGILARRLARSGLVTIGLDPAGASLDVARRQQHAELVRWVEGDVSALVARSLDVSVDLVVMTANVAQVFLGEDEWADTLGVARSVLKPGGHLVFETRVPARRAWEEWTPDRSRSTTDTIEGPVDTWVEVTSVELPFVSFRWTYRFVDDGAELTSDSTLRFRDLADIAAALTTAGFSVRDVRDAPDRPGREWVIIATAS